MPSDHICPDCGRKFASGAALGGHRRVHTKGRLSKNKTRRTRNQPTPKSIQNNTNRNTQFPYNPNRDYIANTRGSPEPYLSTEQKFYGEYITDLSSSENSDYTSDSSNNDKYWNSNEFSAMPPPIKKRKLNNGNEAEQIGYVIQSPINLKKPTKMDAIREQIGLAMTLYHFNVNKLAEYCNIPKEIFIKWLQGGIDQKQNIGVNSNSNSNSNNNSNNKPAKKTKTTIFKIKFKRSQVQKAQEKAQQKGYYLTPILADQIAEKMKKWLDNFIRDGFMNKKYLEFVHHYKRYKKKNNNVNGKEITMHSFDNLDMKWDKIKINNAISNSMNNNPSFDWMDDSSFYYKANRNNKSENINLIPIEINEIIKGKRYKDSFLWDINNSESELKEFINCLCNDLKEYKNEKLKENIYKNALKQIEMNNKIVSEYNNALDKFGNKIPKRSYNYLQHLKKKNIISDNTNVMNNISDICHGHVLIKLNIKQGEIKLMDKFLWNINDIENNNNNNVIEQFANILCADQGLPFNFAASIAIQMRKQINEYKIKMTKSMNNNGNNLNMINDPLSHESLRFVGRNKEIGLKNLKIWQPNIFVHKPPNTMKTKVRE